MDKVIVIDCGHGDRHHTKGKRSPKWSDGSQYFEGEGNRIIAKIAEQYLTKLGWKVLYTVDPSDPTDISLKDRIKISNLHYSIYPSAFQISIHSNGFSKESANGFECFTSNNVSNISKILAIEWVYQQDLTLPNLKFRGIKTANFAMNRVECPSILVETCFHTNERECKILMSKEGKEKIAIAIVETCERVHENRNK